MKLDLAVAIIVKDNSEVEQLERCLKSLKFDGLFITGSHKPDNKIKALTKRFGGEYSYHKWEKDFAKQRNFNFGTIPSLYKYVMFLDTDDVVLNASKLPQVLKDMKEKGVDWLNLTYLYAKDSLGRVVSRQIKPRIFKNGTIKWEKSVHECATPTCKIEITSDDRVVVDHQLKNTDTTKLNRNLEIALKEYQNDKEKTDPRTLFYIAQTLYGQCLWADAAQFFTSYFKHSGWNEEKYFALHSLGHCLVQLNEIDGAIDSSFQMIKLFPNWSLGYFDLSEYYSIKKEYNKAIEWSLVAFQKERPHTFNFTNDMDYTVMPMGRLADAYLMTGKYDMALDIAKQLIKENSDDQLCKELLQTCREVVIKERFVSGFTYCADMIRREDRIKAVKLFDCIPNSLDDDIRIQNARFEIVPPKNWSDKSIVIYCGKGIGEHWAYPSIYTGIGGSEAAVIYMSQELNKLGYEITVYNNCGEFQGNYEGVEYKPYYHFNFKDNFNTLIGWRNPALMGLKISAKKKLVWLHDIAYPEQFNNKIIKNTDKFIFLSKWHRNNMPSIPTDKIFISNNGIVPEDFKEQKNKRPNSLLWTASYDRGLLCLVKDIFPLIKKEIPEVTLDIAYGWNNIDRELEYLPKEIKDLRVELPELFEQEGITEHGRLNEKEVSDLYKTSMVYAYVSEFGETNNISSQKAQASSCYVVTTPQAGGTPERVVFGELIKGNGIYTDKKQQENYVESVVKYLKAPKNAPEGIIERFSWVTTANSWKEIL